MDDIEDVVTIEYEETTEGIIKCLECRQSSSGEPVVIGRAHRWGKTEHSVLAYLAHKRCTPLPILFQLMRQKNERCGIEEERV